VSPSAPIGVFDSGIGGMTVARALTARLPHERLIYFGDTAHLPYGDKSTAAIQAYAVKICDVLLRHGCKLVLIACNSASAAAFDLVKEYVGRRATALNVIDPTVAHLAQTYAGRTVGLIGTKQTVGSGVYARKLAERTDAVALKSLAAPLLAPMIEEGFYEGDVAGHVIRTYLDDPALDGIEALVLACTHYPLIRPEIEQHYAARGRDVEVLDPSDLVAAHVEAYLTHAGLCAPAADEEPTHHFYVSDYTDAFEATTRMFFGRAVHLEPFALWE
jgi:glutamate racemase